MLSKKRIPIGNLRHRITIEENTPTVNTHGDSIDDWDSIGQVWGSIDPFSGTETDSAGQIIATHSHTIILRYWEGLNSRHRFVHDGIIYNIVSVLNAEQRGLLMMCMVQVVDGEN